MRNPRPGASNSGVLSCTHITALSPDILGRVFASIPDKERCNTVPLVCRAWHRIHHSHPPQRSWMSLPQPITPGMLHWCSGGVLAALEELHLCAALREDPGLMYELLPLVAATAPRLTKLEVSDHYVEQHRGKLLGCLAQFSRLESLRIQSWLFNTTDAAHLQCFTGLLSLKDLELHEVYADDVSADQAAGLWGALATLQHLSNLSFTFFQLEPEEYPQMPDLPFFFEHLPLLKHLRGLHLLNAAGTYMGGDDYFGGCLGKLHERFSGLSQLTSLWIADNLAIDAFKPVLGLPLLADVAITVHSGSDESFILNWQSRQLTCLRIQGGGGPLKMSELLPAALIALPQLQILGITGFGLEEFPDEMAATLRSLRELDLSRNAFTRLPPCLAQFSGLESFRLVRNNYLQLEKQDLDTISTLTKLKDFDISKEPEDYDDLSWTEMEQSWTETSVRVLLAFRTRFPHVRLCLDGDVF